VGLQICPGKLQKSVSTSPPFALVEAAMFWAFQKLQEPFWEQQLANRADRALCSTVSSVRLSDTMAALRV